MDDCEDDTDVDDGSGDGDMSTGAVGAVKPSLSVAGTDGASKGLVGVDVGEDVLDDCEDDTDVDDGDTATGDEDVGEVKSTSLDLRADILCRSCAFSVSNDRISSVLL